MTNERTQIEAHDHCLPSNSEPLCTTTKLRFFDMNVTESTLTKF